MLPDLPGFATVLAAAATASAALLLFWAAAHDIVARTIPDGASVALALLGPALRLGEGWAALLVSALTAALLLLGCVLLVARGFLGGGDAKLMAAASLLVPAAAVPALVLDVALAGGALAALYLLLFRLLRSRGAAPRPAPRAGVLRRVRAVEWRRIRRRGPLPYGVAIAAGVALALSGRGA